jgi:hypothetical protein
LLIDDPFVHLDERRVTDLWAVLERIAETRQVIVATQDRLVLAHLGVSPDLELTVPETASGTPDSPYHDRVEQPDVARLEEGVLDLWDDPGKP